MLTKVSGDIDGNSLAQHVIDLNKETEGIFNLRELADYREITSVKLLSTQATTMSAGSEKDKPGSKLAILTPKDKDAVYGMARAYQMFSEDHRKSVKLFRDFQDALMWLSENDLEEESLSVLVNNA